MPVYCQEDGCDREANYGYELGKRLYCGTHKSIDMINTKDRRCNIEGCSALACWGLEDGFAIRCSKHREDEMTYKRGKKCEFEGCNKVAIWGYKGSHTQFCSKHKNNNMCQPKQVCEFEDCITTACFGYEKGKPLRCKTHVLEEMYNVLAKTCEHNGCTTQPTYGYVDEKPRFCSLHKLDTMISISHKKCEFESCQKDARFCFENEKPRFCGKHALKGMFNAKCRKCIKKGCNKYAQFGYRNSIKEYCAKHKKKEMIPLGQKLCIHKNCNNQATCGYDKKDPLYCGEHKPTDAYYLYSYLRNCSVCGLGYRTNKKKNVEYICPYCTPEKNCVHKKELKVVDYLRNHMDLAFTHDKKSADNTTICGKYRPDILVELPDRFIIIEIDENEHKDYEQTCEKAREYQIFEGLGITTIMIRYNHDSYKINGVKEDPPFEERMQKLIKTVKKYKKKDLGELQLRVKYLFYSKDKPKKKIIVV